MNSSHPLHPVILSGGAGTRLWPLSRETFPKQFLPLGQDDRTMLQQTALRMSGLHALLPLSTGVTVVCNAEHRFVAAQQLVEAGFMGSRLVLEPVGRNTAPALTLAALAQSPDEDPVLLVMPADHVIQDVERFQAAVAVAYEAARKGAMVTFGIVPTRAETGYGYICTGAAQGDGTFAITSFAEKPDAETAQAYLDAGGYVWNSGLFMVRSSLWLKALQQCQPAMLTACERAMAGATTDLDFVRPDSVAFTHCPADSIDYAVMEQLPARPEIGVPARVVPLDAGWSDLGAWDALWEVLPHDEHGNAAVGDTLSIGSSNSLLYSRGRLLAAVGLDNVVVVETADAVLVADKRQTQDVKQVVARLKEKGVSLANTHRKVHRPWGWYDSIDSGSRFQVKRIVVNPGARLSLQMHHHRSEHWIVVSGTAEVTNGEETFLLSENESTYIPLGHVHRLSNPGKVPLEIIEVQSGSYLGEDDIVRYEDTYGRAPETPVA